MIFASSPMQSARPMPEALLTIEHLRALLSGFLVTAVLVAVVTLAVLQLVKPLARGLIHWRTARKWLRGEEESWWTDPNRPQELSPAPRPRWVKELRKARLWVPPEEFADLKTGVFDGRFTGASASTRYFMKTIQNAVAAVVQNPSRHITTFRVLTRGAPPEAQATLLWADLFRRFGGDAFLEEAGQPPAADPEGAAADWNRDNTREAQRHRAKEGASHAIAAAQDAIDAQIERSLDALQLELLARWQAGSRYLTLLLGFGLAMLASAATGTLTAATYVVGLGGGAVAAMIDEASGGIIANWRR